MDLYLKYLLGLVMLGIPPACGLLFWIFFWFRISYYAEWCLYVIMGGLLFLIIPGMFFYINWILPYYLNIIK